MHKMWFDKKKKTYLLLSSSMVVVISLCSSSSNLLFWDLFLHQKAQRQLERGRHKGSDTHRLTGIDAGKPDHVMQVTQVQFRWINLLVNLNWGNLVNAILSISEKREMVCACERVI